MPSSSIWNGTLGGIFGSQAVVDQAGWQQDGVVTQVDQATRTVTATAAYQGSIQGLSRQLSMDTWGLPQPREDQAEANSILYHLNRMDCRVFPEVHLTDDLFRKLQARLNITTPVEQPIIYHAGYGPITVRNASYVLNLDKFMEDCTGEEIGPNE